MKRLSIVVCTCLGVWLLLLWLSFLYFYLWGNYYAGYDYGLQTLAMLEELQPWEIDLQNARATNDQHLIGIIQNHIDRVTAANDTKAFWFAINELVRVAVIYSSIAVAVLVPVYLFSLMLVKAKKSLSRN